MLFRSTQDAADASSDSDCSSAPAAAGGDPAERLRALRRSLAAMLRVGRVRRSDAEYYLVWWDWQSNQRKAGSWRVINELVLSRDDAALAAYVDMQLATATAT